MLNQKIIDQGDQIRQMKSKKVAKVKIILIESHYSTILTIQIHVATPGRGARVSSTNSIRWQWQQECCINIKVLLDDSNRIIIPQGNFKIFKN